MDERIPKSKLAETELFLWIDTHIYYNYWLLAYDGYLRLKEYC